MELRSKYPDFHIPDNVSWAQIVYQDFDKYGEKTAIVSTVHWALIFNLKYIYQTRW